MPSERARKLDAQRQSIERIGVRASLLFADPHIEQAISAFETRTGRLSSFGPFERSLAELLAESMRAAHLAGAVSVVQVAAPVLQAEVQLQVFDEAAEFSQRQLDLTDEQLVALLALPWYERLCSHEHGAI